MSCVSECAVVFARRGAGMQKSRIARDGLTFLSFFAVGFTISKNMLHGGGRNSRQMHSNAAPSAWSDDSASEKVPRNCAHGSDAKTLAHRIRYPAWWQDVAGKC